MRTAKDQPKRLQILPANPRESTRMEKEGRSRNRTTGSAGAPRFMATIRVNSRAPIRNATLFSCTPPGAMSLVKNQPNESGDLTAEPDRKKTKTNASPSINGIVALLPFRFHFGPLPRFTLL